MLHVLSQRFKNLSFHNAGIYLLVGLMVIGSSIMMLDLFDWVALSKVGYVLVSTVVFVSFLILYRQTRLGAIKEGE